MQDRIGTTNEIVAESIRTGVPKGYETSTAIKPKSSAEIKCESLSTELATVMDENATLKKRLVELEAKLELFEHPNNPSKLQQAIITDGIVNGEQPE